MKAGDNVTYKQAPISYYLTIGQEYTVVAEARGILQVCNDRGDIRNYPKKFFTKGSGIGTRAGLKTGMAVTFRNGYKAIVYKDTIHGSKLIFSDVGFESLCHYSNSLNHKTEVGYDIMAIHSDSSNPHSIATYEQPKIWSRPEPVKVMTLLQLEKHFGCRVKIIK